MDCWARFWAVLLLAAPAAAQTSSDFEGYLGRLDAAQLGEDWHLHTPATMPSFPLEGSTVSVLDCEEDCPDPVQTDAAGWFTIAGLGRDAARLRFEPPPCAEDDFGCEPLEPREEVLENGGRTVLGAKWPAGIEDTILRYMPLVANTIYIRREGEIPGSPGASGVAGQWAIWVNGRYGWAPYLTTRTFLHELMHVYEFQLRLACWHDNQEIDGFVLQEDWMLAYEADRRLLEENGQPLREPDGEPLTEYQLARETLAWFAEDYFTPEALALGWWGRYQICDSTGCRPGLNPNFMTYRELEPYAPNRYAYFEKLVFQRYLDEKQWRRENPDGEQWPGLCEAPAFDSEQEEEQEEEEGGITWPFATSKSLRRNLNFAPGASGPVNCSLPDHR